MLQLIYVSAAHEPFSPAELAELLRRSRAKNATLGVTGLLLYNAGSFLQVLEGPEDAVRGLAKAIAADPRHHRLKFLFERPIPTTSFSGWAMGFANVAGDDFGKVPGHLDYLTGLNPAPGIWDEDLVRWVLDQFRHGRLRQYVRNDD